MCDFEITKREILVSITIVAIMFVIGLMISDNISDRETEENAKYNKAAKIESKEMFEYGMQTNVGNAFINGELKAVDTVTYPEINGEYMYVEKVKEKYTMHTRTYTVKVGKTTQTRTETYWTWDAIDSESKHSKELEFCGVVLPYKKIDIPGTKYIDTISTGYHLRDVYYGVLAKHKGTIFTKLENNTISDNTNFYENKNIKDTVKSLESSGGEFLFWFFWIILIGVCVFGFYYIDNRWLE